MRILFTAAGSTDPVRGYHDGGLLHILRHYEVDSCIVLLTCEMQAKEEKDHIYSRGIESIGETCHIEWVKTGIEKPQRFEALETLTKVFDEVYAKYPDAKWLLNMSSGTPQIKTVMALLALDYPRVTCIQVDSPEGRANENNHPNKESDMLEMLTMNEDNELDAPNRCTEPNLNLLRRYGLRLKLESLADSYEYESALTLVKSNPGLFGETVERLLRHAVCRQELCWKDANKVIANYQGRQLIDSPSDFAEYFRVMELRQKKGQLPEFIIKLSPILMHLGTKYLESLRPTFDLNRCGYKRKGVFYLKLANIEAYDGALASFIKASLRSPYRDGPMSFNDVVLICQHLSVVFNGERGERHERLTMLFNRLRDIEASVRNLVAHQITKLTEDSIRNIDDKNGRPLGLTSKKILQLLHETVKLISGRDIVWDYPGLSEAIKESLREKAGNEDMAVK